MTCIGRHCGDRRLSATGHTVAADVGRGLCDRLVHSQWQTTTGCFTVVASLGELVDRQAERVRTANLQCAAPTHNLIRVMPAEGMLISIVIVITGAAPLLPGVIATIQQLVHTHADGCVLVAVDGGVDHALDAGFFPEHVVGDFDSISDHSKTWAKSNATVHAYHPEKDSTDTEIALNLAASLNPERLLLVGGGNRIDHTFAAVGALGHISPAQIPHVEAFWDGTKITVIRGPKNQQISAHAGTTLSLLALHGTCSGVSIDGTKWPLVDAELHPVVGFGVSNIAVDSVVNVSVKHGILTVFYDIDDQQ